jgi:hypothetical protein
MKKSPSCKGLMAQKQVPTVRENESLAHLAMEATRVGVWKWDLGSNRIH